MGSFEGVVREFDDVYAAHVSWPKPPPSMDMGRNEMDDAGGSASSRFLRSPASHDDARS